MNNLFIDTLKTRRDKAEFDMAQLYSTIPNDMKEKILASYAEYWEEAHKLAFCRLIEARKQSFQGGIAR